MSTIPDNVTPEALRKEADRREHLAAEEEIRDRYAALIVYMGHLLELGEEERAIGLDHLAVPRVQTMKAIKAAEEAHASEQGWFRLNAPKVEVARLDPVPEGILRYARRERLDGWRGR